jgi:hypothetical protein
MRKLFTFLAVFLYILSITSAELFLQDVELVEFGDLELATTGSSGGTTGAGGASGGGIFGGSSTTGTGSSASSSGKSS